MSKEETLFEPQQDAAGPSPMTITQTQNSPTKNAAIDEDSFHIAAVALQLLATQSSSTISTILSNTTSNEQLANEASEIVMSSLPNNYFEDIFEGIHDQESIHCQISTILAFITGNSDPAIVKKLQDAGEQWSDTHLPLDMSPVDIFYQQMFSPKAISLTDIDRLMRKGSPPLFQDEYPLLDKAMEYLHRSRQSYQPLSRYSMNESLATLPIFLSLLQNNNEFADQKAIDAAKELGAAEDLVSIIQEFLETTESLTLAPCTPKIPLVNPEQIFPAWDDKMFLHLFERLDKVTELKPLKMLTSYITQCHVLFSPDLEVVNNIPEMNLEQFDEFFFNAYAQMCSNAAEAKKNDMKRGSGGDPGDDGGGGDHGPDDSDDSDEEDDPDTDDKVAGELSNIIPIKDIARNQAGRMIGIWVISKVQEMMRTRMYEVNAQYALAKTEVRQLLGKQQYLQSLLHKFQKDKNHGLNMVSIVHCHFFALLVVSS